MDWLIHSFKREIDRDYPTLPGRDHSFIAGSSMGGLMSLYAVSCFNETFSRAAALSPALDFAPRSLEKRVRLTARIVPDGGHCEASWEKQIPFFLPALLYEREE